VIRLRWMQPGLGFKRWMLLGLVGISLAGTAIATWIGMTDPGPDSPLRHVLATLPAAGALALFALGVGICTFAFFRLHRNLMLSLTSPAESEGFAGTYLRRRLLQRGPRVVAVGGGTGLSSILEGLKEHSSNLTAVVTVSDDGGSSGRLVKDLAILPPGDIRNCLVALARRGPLLSNLLQHRFDKGEGLQGHSLGNLLLAALTQITGSFLEAVRATSEVLAIAGEVLPATCQSVDLVGHFVDGRQVRGESAIAKVGARIARVTLDPPGAHPPTEIFTRVADADLVVLGPGSLYTSVIPNLLVSGVADAVNGTSAPVVYIANIMTQPGETSGYTLGDHVHALLDTTPLQRIDYVLVNDRSVGSDRLLAYERQGSTVVVVDEDFRTRFDVRVVPADLLSLDGLVRHDPRKTASALVSLLATARARLA